ncbi:MAG: Uma2 family endonuclease [Synechococcales bacterium]|nr:Uma2 family endonuclease [Synechococcales bacterium]
MPQSDPSTLPAPPIDPRQLPTSEELPCSDDTPVDNEDQNSLPNMLLFLLEILWAERYDWYFGVDMGIYALPDRPYQAIIPDAFLSLGVERRKASRKGKGRLSYVFWEENYIPPILVLEMVSHTYGQEYGDKMTQYAALGILYYVIYNPEYWRRDRHDPFEVYQLVAGQYQRLQGEPLWMPEIGLGIGRCQRRVGGLEREILAWYDAQGDRHLSAEERVAQEAQRANQEAQRADRERAEKEKLLDYLRSLGIDPETLP